MNAAAGVLEALGRFREACANQPSIGRRQTIAGTECIVHRPHGEHGALPAVFVLHGGAWIGGDAVQIDSLCALFARETPAVVFNVNYTKVDQRPFPCQAEEVCALLDHVARHASRYGVSPRGLALCGHSAGAHISASAAILCRDRGIPLSRQILIYPFVDWSGLVPNPLEDYGIEGIPCQEFLARFFPQMALEDPVMSPLRLDRERASGLAAADIIICGDDDIRSHGAAYYERLTALGVKATLKEYPQARHGFLEVNRPDCAGEYEAKSPLQALYARDCEAYILGILRHLSGAETAGREK